MWADVCKALEGRACPHLLKPKACRTALDPMASPEPISALRASPRLLPLVKPDLRVCSSV